MQVNETESEEKADEKELPLPYDQLAVLYKKAAKENSALRAENLNLLEQNAELRAKVYAAQP